MRFAFSDDLGVLMYRLMYSLMRRPLLLLLCLQPTLAQAGWLWGGDDELQPQVRVVVPFIQWHTGPASAYPVFHVSESGEWLTLLSRKTQWLKVRDHKGREGWVALADVQLTQDGAGEPVRLSEPRFDDFSSRRWEVGFMLGRFDDASVNSAYAGYWMTENLALELSGSQILSNASESLLVSASLLHQPFPRWRVSPFFTLGVGQIFIDPKSSLSNPDSRDDTVAHAGLGLRFYISDRYFLRAEVKDYTVFTDRETNEEATEWKLGFSVFF